MVCIGSILAGYLIGSFIPGYFLGRLKGIDIRRVGRHYAGTLNVYHVLGFWPAVPTAAVDTLKGIFAILLVQRMGAGFACAQLSGLAAIAGHVLPFYIGFRGGQGTACATGILLFYLAKYISAGALGLGTLGLLLALVAIFSYVARAGEVVGIVVLPLLGYSVISNQPHNPYNPYLLAVVLYIIGVGIYNIVTRKLIQIGDETFRLHWWRVALRPGALAFVLFYLDHTRIETLKLIGSVALFFILLDLVRFVHRRTEEIFTVRFKSFFKRAERRRFSSMTMFLIAAFVAVLVFSREIAIPALIFLIFGDIFSKIFGMAFGRHRVFEKTLEGSLAYLGGALICAYIVHTALGLQMPLLVVGAVAAAVAEAMPLGVDDNFTVAVMGGTAMLVAEMFGI